jgi:acyl dehydratase
MVKKMKEISPGRYRESFGRYYEEFVVGDIYEHRPGRTITQSDNIWFTLLTMNQHPLHVDDEYGKGTEFGKTLVVSPFTVALMVGMSVSDVSQKTVANLGWTDIKMTHPLYVGDTLYAESEVIEKRESKSRPTQGIVRVRHIGKNQDNVIVMDMVRSFLVAKRGHSVVDEIISKTK